MGSPFLGNRMDIRTIEKFEATELGKMNIELLVGFNKPYGPIILSEQSIRKEKGNADNARQRFGNRTEHRHGGSRLQKAATTLSSFATLIKT